MTRFSLTLEDGVNSAIYSLNHARRRDLYPKSEKL